MGRRRAWGSERASGGKGDCEEYVKSGDAENFKDLMFRET